MKVMGRTFSVALVIFFSLMVTVNHAKVNGHTAEESISAAVEATATSESVSTKSTDTVKNLLDLKTRTEVSKTLSRSEDTATGKMFVYVYRIQARPTATDTPRYLVDPSYSISYTTSGFQANDTITLISDNTEKGTDSPIWVYEVTYVGAGTRTITFTTAGEVEVAAYTRVSGEEVLKEHCAICGHDDPSQCTEACLCCCFNTNTHCDCIGCQLQNPRCFTCPVGCTCAHCVCSCDGCLNQNPACHSCPPDCNCSHCQCLCESNVDHEGICGCRECKYGDCDCECHNDCP